MIARLALVAVALASLAYAAALVNRRNRKKGERARAARLAALPRNTRVVVVAGREVVDKVRASRVFDQGPDGSDAA